jgi:hypothetical protein
MNVETILSAFCEIVNFFKASHQMGVKLRNVYPLGSYEKHFF